MRRLVGPEPLATYIAYAELRLDVVAERMKCRIERYGHHRAVSLVSGSLLVVLGFLMVTNLLVRLAALVA